MRLKYHSLKHFFLPSARQFSIDWGREFGRRAPLVVEIGFGAGEFLIRKAQEEPEKNFIGIEYHWMPMSKALRSIYNAGVTNARLVFADARVVFERLFEEKSLERVYALFPDPWFKRRHEKYRLFSSDFLKLAGNRLQPKGVLEIVTDNLDYFEWILEQSRSTGFSVQNEEIDARFNTKYERKWSAAGQKKFYRLILAKKRHTNISRNREAVLRTYHFAHFDPDDFSPNGASGKNTVVFKEFLFDPRKNKGMLHAIASEEHLTQQFWIAIEQQGQGWRLGPAEGCSVLPTDSAKKALELACQAAAKTSKN